MKKTTFFLVAILLLQGSSAIAQQDPQFSHNMFNHTAVNPGFAGSSGRINITAINRQQWVGFDGAPVTTLFSADAALKPFGIKSGVGLTIIQDEIGFEKDFHIKAAYAYRMNLGAGELAAGVTFGLVNKSLEAEWEVPSGSDFTPPSGDPSIPDDQSKMAFDMGFGLFYSDSKMYVGLSTAHLNQAQFKLEKGTPSLQRHYFLTAGYNIELPFPLFELQPSTFIKFDGTSAQVSANARVIYNKKFWGGVTYRLGDAFVAMAGIELFNGLKIGYSYDVTTSKIRKYSSGSHEVFINYQFSLDFGKGAHRYKSVRFL